MSSRVRWATAAVLLGVVAGVASLAPGQQRGHSMREMMRDMMRGAVPPPGMVREGLPEPDSEGADLLARYCTQCHDMPSPRYKTAAQWPEAFERMAGRMRMMSGGMMGGGGMGSRIEAPDLTNSRTLLAYLIRNSMIAALSRDLEAADPADRGVFAAACSQCHVPPSPKMLASDAWPGTVARMEANIQSMGRTPIGDRERAAILRLLQAASKPTSKGE